MPISWNEDLATGVEIIDLQHKELFARVNDLLSACMNGEGTEHVIRTIEYLQNYVVEHFEMEEEVMRTAQYAGYEQHRALHLAFRAEVEAIARDVFVNGLGAHTVVKVNRTVVDWLNHHIRRVDRAMAVALREQFKTANAAAT